MRAGVIIAGVLAVGVAAIVFIKMDGGETAQQQNTQVSAAPEVKATNIYVAATAIPVGTVVTQDMLAVQPWPQHLMLEGFMKSDEGSKDAIGYVARSAFQPQEPIIKSKLANPSDPNFLAGELPKGMRVITVMTNETEGVAGFVFPGDRVDVILTHEVERVQLAATDPTQQQVQSVKDPVTETILTNVRVVAVDQRAAGGQTVDDQGRLIIPRSVSLMVSQTDAQRVRLGQKVGTLTLALRSLADRDAADPLTLTQVPDISQYKSGSAVGGPGGSTIKIYRGAKTDGPVSAAPISISPAQNTGAMMPNNAIQPQPAGQQ